MFTKRPKIAVLTIALSTIFAWCPVLAQESWISLGLTGANTQCVAVAPGNSNLIIVGGTGLSVSTDGGQTWTSKAGPQQVRTVAFGVNQSTAYVGCWGQGVYESTDGGTSWTQRNSGLNNTVIKSICVSSDGLPTVFAAAEDGLYRRQGSASAWAKVKGEVNASAVAIAPADNMAVYLGTWGGGTWKSTNGGTTWSQITVATVPDNATCYGIAVDPNSADTVYAVFKEQGAWISTDGGTNWSSISPVFEGQGIAVDTLRSGFVYGTGGWTNPQRSGSYGALGWTTMSSGYDGGFARGIAVDPNDSSKIYVCSTNSLLRWTADTLAPNAPGTLSASPRAGGGISLSWTASSSTDCTGYWVYRSTNPGTYPLVPTATVSGRTTVTYTDTSTASGMTYYYKVTAIDGGQNRSVFTNEANSTSVASYELDIAYITRLPKDCYRYRVNYTNGIPTLVPGTENQKRWPAEGETVTFEAHIVNKGTANPGPVNFRWKIDGSVVGTGSIPGVNGGEETTATVSWPWHLSGPLNATGQDTDHSNRTVTFEIDYDNRIAETFEQNNTLTDFVEACSLLISVEQPIYDAFNTHLTLAGTYGFEDWIQRQIKAMNDNFARSTYPLAPNGCLERVRIDKIVIGPPPTDDFLTDGRWQFIGDPSYAQTFATSVDAGLIHELMHQLGVIDLYNFPVVADGNEVTTPDGIPNGTTWSWGRGGIMSGGDISPHQSGHTSTMPEYCSAHDVIGLNRNCGYKRGYYGEYLFDIPAENYILVRDSAGALAPNVTITIYKANFGQLPRTPVITGRTDANGAFLLTNIPPAQIITTATGHTTHGNPFGTVNVVGGQSVLLVEMSRPGGDFDYAWMDLSQFNLAYWKGNTASWTYTINSRLGASAIPRITDLNGMVQGSVVSVTWPSVTGAVSYKVYRASPYLNQASDPSHTYENWVYRPIWAGVATSYSDSSKAETSRYAVVSVDAQGLESALSNRFFAPTLVNPASVVINSDNTRLVLDPQNGYAFLRQDAKGVYTGNTGSVHNHVEYSQFMAIDRPRNRLLISHPSDWYGGPHSIRITDLNASLNGLVDLGTQGTGPGQFNTPAGVAVDSNGRIYAVDKGNNRIQVFGSSGSFLVAYGVLGAGAGQFNAPRGIAVDSRNRIYVCDTNNRRVQILQFNSASNTISYIGVLTGRTLTSPVGVAIGLGDSVFVTDTSTSRVEAYNSGGIWMSAYTTPDLPYTSQMINPTGIAVDNNGTLIVCDTGRDRVVSITAFSPLEKWKLTNFGDAYAPDDGDNDSDGLTNLLEYAIGENPLVSNPAPSVERGDYGPAGTRLRIVFPRDAAKTDIRILVEASGTLNPADWETLATSEYGSVTTGPGYVGGDSIGPGVKRVEVRDTTVVSEAPRRFLRMRVTR